MKIGQWRTTVAGLALGVCLSVSMAPAAVAGEQTYWTDAGLGVGSVLVNLAYMPAKITYAALGAVTGGLTYALTGGSHETASNVWTAALGGSYVVVPDMLTGRQPIEFSGTPRAASEMIVEEPVSLAREPAVATEYPVESGGYIDSGY